MRVSRFVRSTWSALVVVTGLAAGLSVAQSPSRSPHAVNYAVFPVSVATGTYDLYAWVVDFPPGSATPRHVHGGPVVVTVISGELVLQRAGAERVLKPGDSFIENPGEPHGLLNRSGAPARMAASELIPKGAPETTVVKESR